MLLLEHILHRLNEQEVRTLSHLDDHKLLGRRLVVVSFLVIYANYRYKCLPGQSTGRREPPGYDSLSPMPGRSGVIKRNFKEVASSS